MLGIQVPLGKVGGGHLPIVSEMQRENMEAEAQKWSRAACVGVVLRRQRGSKRKRQQHVSVSYSLLDLVPLLKHSSEFLHQYLIIKYTSNPVIHFFSKNFLRAYFVTIFLLQTLLNIIPNP